MSDRSGSYERTPDYDDGRGSNEVHTEFRVDLTSSSHRNGFSSSKGNYGEPLAPPTNNYGKRTSRWIDDGPDGSSASHRKERTRPRDVHSSDDREASKYHDIKQLESAIFVQIIYNELMQKYVKSSGETASARVLAEDMAKARILMKVDNMVSRVSATIGQLGVSRWVPPDEKNTVSKAIMDKMRRSSSFLRVMEDVIEKFQCTDDQFARTLKAALSDARSMIKSNSYAQYWEDDRVSEETRPPSSSDSHHRTSHRERESSSQQRHRSSSRYRDNDKSTTSHSQSSRNRSSTRETSTTSNNNNNNNNTSSSWGDPVVDVNKDTWNVWGKPENNGNNSNWDAPDTHESSNQQQQQSQQQQQTVNPATPVSYQRSPSPARSISSTRGTSSVSVLGAAAKAGKSSRSSHTIPNTDAMSTTPHNISPFGKEHRPSSSAISVSSNSPMGSPRLLGGHQSSMIEIRDEEQHHHNVVRRASHGSQSMPYSTTTPVSNRSTISTSMTPNSLGSMHSNQSPSSVSSSTMMMTMPPSYNNYTTPMAHTAPLSNMGPPLNTASSHFNTSHPTMMAAASPLTPSMPGMHNMPMPHTNMPHSNNSSNTNNNNANSNSNSNSTIGVLDEATLTSAYLNELEQQHLKYLIEKIPIHLRRALLTRWLQ
ncbi:hypothetical protein BDF22DRAFT_744073 [Syncephalis plumigaleata]|nr:hypothetical protein BDF22DRAFT_744073 [Syncephalis plumigaleata]